MKLSRNDMTGLLGDGALEFTGSAAEFPFSDQQDEDAHRYYSSTFIGTGKRGRCYTTDTDLAAGQNEALREISLCFMGRDENMEPKGSLEYPNMLYAFGRSPGTTSLTWYVGMRGQLRTPVDFSRGSEARKRKMKLISILERLNELTPQGLREHPDDQHHFLYTRLIEDPAGASGRPHVDKHVQIIDLMKVLMNKEWTDFSIPKNQVVAKFFDSPDDKVKQRFFHQLLLAVELHLRIHDDSHIEDAKRTLLKQLPPKVLWDLALAQRWLENMTIHQDALSDEDSEFTFHLSQKKRQKVALRHFARLLKWPNMEELGYILKADDDLDNDSNANSSAAGGASGPIEEKSADTMSWFTGVILPGPTLPFLLMNSLIDCDDDTQGKLQYLTHVRPNCGFQYRANTYWSYKCVLGKVLGAARGVRQVAGWIGPCHFSPDLARTQCALIKTRTSRERESEISVEDVEDMEERSDCIGIERQNFVVGDYHVPVFPVDGAANYTSSDDGAIRMQKIAFKEALPDASSLSSDQLSGTPKKSVPKGAKLYDAAVVFAFAGGANVPVRLRHDVDFIQAPACENGPHALWKGYKTRWVRVVADGLRDLHGLEDLESLGPNSNPENGHDDIAGLQSSRALALALSTPTKAPSTLHKRSGSGNSAANQLGDYYQYDIYERDWDRISDATGSGSEHLRYYLHERASMGAKRGKNGSEHSSHGENKRQGRQLVIRGNPGKTSGSLVSAGVSAGSVASARGIPSNNTPYHYERDEHHLSEGEEDSEDEDEAEDEEASNSSSSESEVDVTPVLLIDSTGVSDNEVFARAWCAHWGTDAVVANVSRGALDAAVQQQHGEVQGTCIACAVRLAVAAKVGVVILTEGGLEEERDRGVWEGE
jgi:hypothetical protein